MPDVDDALRAEELARFQAMRRMLDDTLREYGIGPGAQTPDEVITPILFTQHGQRIGLERTLNIEGTWGRLEHEPGAGRVNLVLLGEDVYTLLMRMDPSETAPLASTFPNEWVQLQFDGVFTSWEITANAPGSWTADIMTATYDDFPVFSSIAGSQLPHLETGLQKGRAMDLDTWTRPFAAFTYLGYRNTVVGPATMDKGLVALQIRRQPLRASP
jgi:hypothetical protein